MDDYGKNSHRMGSALGNILPSASDSEQWKDKEIIQSSDAESCSAMSPCPLQGLSMYVCGSVID